MGTEAVGSRARIGTASLDAGGDMTAVVSGSVLLLLRGLLPPLCRRRPVPSPPPLLCPFPPLPRCLLSSVSAAIDTLSPCHLPVCCHHPLPSTSCSSPLLSPSPPLSCLFLAAAVGFGLLSPPDLHSRGAPWLSPPSAGRFAEAQQEARSPPGTLCTGQ
ncbi:unnamed protein product, partial [Ranitomeya imitator]